MNEPLDIALCLRTGFRHPQQNDLRFAGDVHAYTLAQSLSEVLPELQRSRARWLCFMDDAIRLTEPALRKLLRLLQNGNLAGVTLDTPALQGLFPASRTNDFARIGQSGGIHATVNATPWFMVLRRDALEASGFFVNHWHSLEYAMLGFSEWASKQKAPLLQLDHPPLQLDGAAWKSDVLLHAGEFLAQDYARAQEHEVSYAVPAQYRVELVGSYASNEVLDVPRGDDAFQPRFTVLCPAYKSRFFETTLKSVLNQTYRDFEFIVVIDGPRQAEEDTLVEILQRHEDPRVRFECQENRGTGPTRSYLATLATGDYIVSVDDDDFLYPDTLELFARAAGAHPDARILRGGTQITGLVQRYLRPRPRKLVDAVPCDLFEVNQPWAIARELVHQLDGFEGDPAMALAGEDTDFFLKADESRAETLIIDRPMYGRRLSSFNQTLSSAPGAFQKHLAWLNDRHTKHWNYESANFFEHGGFIEQVFTYSRGDQELVTATSYFNYNTKGGCSEVIIDLEVTALCNADCTFCPRENLGRKDRYLAMGHVQNLAAMIEAESGGRKVVLCGIGEPTLHPQIVDIVRTLSRAGATVCMTNNGSRMTIELFRKLADAGLVEMNFSVNAATRETRELVMRRKDFDKVRSNVLAVLRERDAQHPQVDINVSFVLCPQNQHEVHEFVAMWRDESVKRCWVHPVNNRANLLESEFCKLDPQAVYDRYEGDDRVIVDLWDHGFQPEYPEVCTIAQTLMFITADGDMLLCALDHERKNVVGNLGNLSALQLHLEKINRYRRGEFARFCKGCTYCPRAMQAAAV